jgi:hypothetical protein
MAELLVSVWFELVGADRDDLDDATASRISRKLNEEEKGPREHRLRWRDGEDAPWLEWRIEWVLEGTATEDAEASKLANELGTTARTLASHRFLGSALSQTQGTFRFNLLLPNLRDAKLIRARLSIPLRYDDKRVLEPDPRSVLRALFENDHAFGADIEGDFAGLRSRIDDSSLVVEGGSIEVLARVGTKYLKADRRDPRSPLYQPAFMLARRRPYWAVASILILLGSFGLSWLPLHYWSIGILAGGTGVAVAWALWRGSRDGRAASTLFGLVPVLLLVVFACVYGVALLAESGIEFSTIGDSSYLREPLLLSLSLAGTAGFLDAQVSGWARSIAYLEMLLAVGYVGTASVVAVRAASGRLDRALAVLLLERRQAGR